MVARISIQFATKSSIVTIASLLRMLSAKHMGTMNAVGAVNRLASAVLRARGPSRIAAVPIRQIAAIDVVGRISSIRPTFLKGRAPRRELAHFQ
jgi:hypothetical protein